MSTHVYVLQRLKALGDGENGATIVHWTLWESALNAYCSEVQRPITPIFIPYIVFRQVNAWGKNQRRRLFECKVLKGHSCSRCGPSRPKDLLNLFAKAVVVEYNKISKCDRIAFIQVRRTDKIYAHQGSVSIY